MEIGAQFFTVREFCKDLDGFAEALKRVADIGYRYVQISGTCPFEADWLAQQLKQNGLQCVLTHTPAQKLIEETQQVARDHTVFGCEHVGLGWYAFKEEEEDKSLANYLNVYTPVAEALNKNGKVFMHHNHAQEFKKIGGRLIMEHLAEHFPAEGFGFTLDTYWVQKGGCTPQAWLEKLSGRVPVIHLKDYAFDGTMAVVGEGNLDFDKIFEKAESAGTKYMLVEQDDCNGEDPFDCLARSYHYLKSCGI